MQKLVCEKKTSNPQICPSDVQKPLEISDIEKFYLEGCKEDFKIGLEYERLSLDKATLLNAPHEKLATILEHFCKICNWELVYDNETIIGAKDYNSSSTLSLEPGCQLELSLAPEKNVLDIELSARKILNLLDNIAKIYDVIFLGYGITPKDEVQNIALLNKERYKIMNNYLPDCTKAKYCRKMMRQSAGIQINIDYKSEEDCFYKLKFFNLVMPFIAALFANSPIEKNALSKYKAARALVWRYTGADRCNFFYKRALNKLFAKNNLFKNYIKEVLSVPMVYFEREGRNYPLFGKINFKEFMKSGYVKNCADYQDYLLHQSLCFPDIRLKNYIEIRNHDSSSLDIALSLCAFYKGLCREDFCALSKKFSFLKLDKVDLYNEKTIEEGLSYCPTRNISGWDIVDELFDISKKNLSSKERMYLKPVFEMLKKRKTQADMLIEFGIDNASSLVNFCQDV